MYDFRKVWQVADYLAQLDSEEYVRSAISRYYYSLFGCVRIYLVVIRHEYSFEYGSDVHQRVCMRLKNSTDSTEHSLGKRLEKLRELRNLADYDWMRKDEEFFLKNISYVKNESLKGLNEVDALRQSPPFEL